MGLSTFGGQVWKRKKKVVTKIWSKADLQTLIELGWVFFTCMILWIFLMGLSLYLNEIYG